MNRYMAVAWTLTLIVAIWAIVAGNVDSIPTWTIAIPAMVAGFWWAFGRNVIPENEDRQLPRDS